MSISVEAVYEDGVLRPVEPLPLKEHEKVRITVEENSAWRTSRVRATAGLLRWKGDVETIERMALDPEFGVKEAP
jgi:predicted DNA-binding antitoxin AbrB/MazE fold protein